MGKATNTAEFVGRYPATVTAAATARLGVGDWVALWVADDEVLSDVAIVVSELVSNAVTASRPGADVLVRSCRVRDDLVIEVTNESEAEVFTATWDVEDPLRTGGRGMIIVAALVDSLDIEVGPSTTTVRCIRGIDRDSVRR